MSSDVLMHWALHIWTPNTHTHTHTRCWYIKANHVNDASFEPFFSTNKADWTWNDQCVHSTCRKILGETGASASWYRGCVCVCGHARGHNTAQIHPVFSSFPEHTQTDSYTQLVTHWCRHVRNLDRRRRRWVEKCARWHECAHILPVEERNQVCLVFMYGNKHKFKMFVLIIRIMVIEDTQQHAKLVKLAPSQLATI